MTINKTKKLGKGIEDISYLFLSSSDSDENSLGKNNSAYEERTVKNIADIPVKSVCLIGDNYFNFQNAFLVINLSLALARLSMKIAVIDMDEEFPCLNFFLGKETENSKLEFSEPEEIIMEGPLGVNLIGLNEATLKNFSTNNDKKNKLLALLNKIESDVDLIIIHVMPKSLSNIKYLFTESIKEFLVLVPSDKNRMLEAYKMIKMIFHINSLSKIGIIVTNIDHMYEIEAVYNKMSEVVKKYLSKQLYKYGFLFKIKQEIDSHANIVSFYDADLTACISNIAQIVVLRLNLGEPVLTRESLFEKILTNFEMQTIKDD